MEKIVHKKPKFDKLDPRVLLRFIFSQLTYLNAPSRSVAIKTSATKILSFSHAVTEK